MSRGLWHRLQNRLQRDDVYSRSEFWDDKARAYRGSAVSQWPNTTLNDLLHEEQLDLLGRWFPDLQGWNILDVGCGTGRISRYLSQRGANVTAMDFSAETLSHARRESGALPINWIQAAVPDWPEGGPWNAALSFGCLTVACKSREEFVHAWDSLGRHMAENSSILQVEPFHEGFLHRVLNLSLDSVIQIGNELGWELCKSAPLHPWPVRFLLCHANFPPRLTRWVWRAGRCLLAAPSMGDYHALLWRNRTSKD